MLALELVTPEKAVFQGNIICIVAPGKVGYFEILKNHAPFMSSLVQGEARVIDQYNHLHTYRIEGGVLVVKRNVVDLLADSVEFL